MARQTKPAEQPAAEQPQAQSGGHRNYDERKWLVPSTRAKGYADERKKKVHMFGKKNGEPLSEYDNGIRSGYLLCQSDHAGMYKFKKALSENKSIEEARRISKQKGKKGA